MTDFLEQWHTDHPGATSAMVSDQSYRAVVNAVEGLAGPIVDLACGDGYLLSLLGSGVGIDYTEAELRAARRRGSAALARGDAARLPVATGSAGVVTCHFALMLLQPLEAVLTEIRRVLTPGGVFAAALPVAFPDDEPNAWMVLRSAFAEVHDPDTMPIPAIQDVRALDIDALSSLLAAAGFAPVSASSVVLRTRRTEADAKASILLTYLPALLPDSAAAEFDRLVEAGLAQASASAGADGYVTMVEEVAIVVATAAA